MSPIFFYLFQTSSSQFSPNTVFLYLCLASVWDADEECFSLLHGSLLFLFSTSWSFSAGFLLTYSTVFLFADSLLTNSYSVLSIYLQI